MIAGLCNVKERAGRLERRSKTWKKTLKKRVGGYLADAKNKRENLLASENLLDDNFESDQEEDDDDLTQEEKYLLAIKRRRERLAWF